MKTAMQHAVSEALKVIQKHNEADERDTEQLESNLRAICSEYDVTRDQLEVGLNAKTMEVASTYEVWSEKNGSMVMYDSYRKIEDAFNAMHVLITEGRDKVQITVIN